MNDRKKVPLKKFLWRGGVTRKFLLERGLIFNRGVENFFPKKYACQERGREKIEEGCYPQINYPIISKRVVKQYNKILQNLIENMK